MSRAQLKRSVFILICLMAILLAAIICTGSPGGEKESIQAVMRDAVLHEGDRVSLFGLMDVNPGLISAFTVTGVIFVVCLILRIFVIPKFQYVPGKVQLVLEEIVNLFDGLAKTNSPHRNKFLSVYLFTAGVYIFIGTIFELFGVQAVTVAGNSVSLPAPLADVNGAIALGCLSYVIILSGGIAGDGANGVGKTLKEFSLPISMSFRLFGALLSGALVTELVYYYIQLSFVLPVIVGVLFTLLHALIQAYVLTMLTALFYGEVSEPTPRKPRKAKKGKRQKAASQP
jgi:F-type H+-transporting ATPase subunit a